jgi:hypothetical protein
MSTRAIIVSALSLVACEAVVPSSNDPASTTSDGGTLTSSTSASSPATSVSTTTSNDDDTQVAELDSGFIPAFDAGAHNECEIWAQDCPVGQKCMPWANDGGNTWNARRCSPVAEDPQAAGDPCTVEGNGVSGIDDCELGAMCWEVDPETNMGTCVAQCKGDEGHPICTPYTECYVGQESNMVLCLPICDPLAQTCNEGMGCYGVNETFACAPDASADDGAFGDSCEFINVCDPGLYCAAPEVVPNCNASGCCSAFCDITAANYCPGIGQQCVRWYGVGQAPPGLENVGACELP